MASIEITQENFREIYKNNEVVVLDFWAMWCGPCHAFAPVFEEMSEKYPQVLFGKVNTEAEADLAAYFQIRSIPSIFIIREQLEVFSHSGSIASEQLDTILRQVLSADMNEIRKKIEELEGEN